MGIPYGAGKLNQVCEFQIRSFGVTARGGPSESWSSVFQARCVFDASKTLKYVRMGARDIAAEDRKGLQEGQFIVRYRESLSPNARPDPRDTYRIVLNGRAWNISDIREMPGGKRIFLEIDVTEQIDLAVEV
jgi:head-tail adaptor